MNMFVCMQCDSYLELSSRDKFVAYIVASDERIRLQCEVIFGGGNQRLSHSSDKHVRLLFGSWLRNSPKEEQKLVEKVSEKTSHQVKAGTEKGQKHGRDGKLKNTTLLLRIG